MTRLQNAVLLASAHRKPPSGIVFSTLAWSKSPPICHTPHPSLLPHAHTASLTDTTCTIHGCFTLDIYGISRDAVVTYIPERGRIALYQSHHSEKAMAPHSSTLAWKIPWTEEPGGLQSMGSRRVGHDWATSLSFFTFIHWRRKWQPSPMFLPGESQGQGSLVGFRPWGRTESDTTEAT